MMVKFLKLNQPVCIILWLVIAYNLAFPLPGIFYSIFLYILPVLVIVHFFEWLVLRGKLAQRGHTGLKTFALVIIYGLFWWVPALHSDESSPA